uniref:Nardilysin b (N-arginine dibasic convertase) n=1 Tax=Callorhinchus milii TaxID=7868 RepID=A0A4W3IYV7_CALMI
MIHNRSDADIVKSPNDPKEYRYIKLENGLSALLISDMSIGTKRTDSESLSEEEDSEDYSESSGSDSAEDSIEEFEDPGRPFNIPKGAEKQSAAGLCIGIGSFSDPEDLPGLAHFLEHMVFMGSEKFPDEDGFDAFLKKHGGSDNASTDCETTVFQFDIQRKYFKEALDRWAQFFIGPLMIRDTIDREVEAVDSEFQLAIPSDSSRKEVLFGSLAKPGHPMSKFFWGNSQTLKHNPKQQGIDVHARLQEFWKRHYSAHYITLAVQSKVVPVTKVHSLNITWALPPQKQHYRVKPLQYISWLIGHEGKGSILSLLRKMCLALALFAGNDETGFEQNSTYSVFNISITLTDEGYEQFYEVKTSIICFSRIYEEIQKIEDNDFHYQEQTDPIDYVEDICENMQLYKKEDFLTGNQLLFEYKPEVIATALSYLKPQRANLILLSPNNEGQCNLKEQWFGTQYSVEDVVKRWAEIWKGDFTLNAELHLPVENKFIATDFALKNSDCTDTEYPVKVLGKEYGCVWYKKDNKFKIPKGYIRFHLISPLIQESPENLVLFDLFVNILAHNLAEPAYEADVAQLEYSLLAEEHGLVIKVKGFNHKLELLFQLIIDHLAQFTTTPEVFAMITEQLKKSYFNILIKPEKLGKEIRLLILEHGHWSLMEKYQALMNASTTVETLTSFVKKFKQELFIEGLVQGNFTSKIVKRLQTILHLVELPQKAYICKVKSLNKGDANSEVTVYYQMHMDEPCFDCLRTKETLGYNVYPTCRNTSGIVGFSVTVETQATKYSTEYVDKKIEEFLFSFYKRLQNMNQDAFHSQVTALIKLKQCEDIHLGEEVDRNWAEIFTQQYLFDRLNHEIQALKSFTKNDLVQWFKAHRGKNSRKLSIHVVGFGQHEYEDHDKGLNESLYGEVSQLTFLPISKLMENSLPINNFQSFTETLNLFPFHKILK